MRGKRLRLFAAGVLAFSLSRRRAAATTTEAAAAEAAQTAAGECAQVRTR